jgi:hypothetical protein
MAGKGARRIARVGGGDTQQAEAIAERIFQARVAEYVSAREAMISAIANQHLVLTFGSASLVGVFVAGFLIWEQPIVAAIFFAAPPISAWVLAMWLAEVVRMLGSIAFCREQEEIVARSLNMLGQDHPPLRWEAWRDQERHRTVRWSYISVVAVLVGAYLGGVVLGLVVADWSTCWTVIAAGLFALGLVAVLAALLLVYARWSHPPSKIGMPRFWS